MNIWERYIVGSDNQQDTAVMQRKVVLQHLALFKRFGFERMVVEESKAIARLIEPEVTWIQFQQIIKKLKERKILQGQTTLYITPKALHIYLWKEWWNTFGNSFNLEDFSAKLSNSLCEWFYEMFQYAAESRAASQVVEELFGSSAELVQGLSWMS